MSKIYIVYEQDYDSPPEFVKAFRTKAKAGAFCRKANREVTCPDCKGTLVSGRYDRDTQLISTVGMNDPPGSGFRLAKKGDPNGQALPQWPAYDPARHTTMLLGARVGSMDLAEPSRLSQLLGELKE